MEYCVHCGHDWGSHHYVKSPDTNEREIGPCDYPLATGKPGSPDLCGCSRYFGRIAYPQKWLVIWSSAISHGNDLVTYPSHLLRNQVIGRYERQHPNCSVDELISRGSDFDEGAA